VRPVPHASLNRLTTALWQCEQVVVPLPVGMRAEVLTVRPIHDCDIGTLSTHERVERVLASVDRVDDLLPCPPPRRPTEVGDAFMRILPRLLIDTRYLYICHFRPPSAFLPMTGATTVLMLTTEPRSLVSRARREMTGWRRPAGRM
jgi:hypothetical protein